MALAFLEALIMEDGHKAQAIAYANTEADLDDIFFTASKVLAPLMESHYGGITPLSRRSTNGDRPAGDSFTAAASPS